MTLFLALVDRFGFAAGVVVLAISGVCEMAPFIFGKFGVLIPEALAHGAGKVGGAIALAAFARNTTRSEAEKRISDPSLTPGPGPSSIVPAIQNEIVKQQAAIATGSQPRPTNGVKKP